MPNPADFTALPGGNEEYHDQDWSVAALGDVNLVGYGDMVYISGSGTGTGVQVIATSAVSLFCGPAQIVVSSQSEGLAGAIVLAAGLDGMIEQTVGVPNLGARVTAKPESLEMNVGVPELGANVQLSPESITLRVGPPGVGASITMTPESITLKIGTTVLTLTPEGIAEDVAGVTSRGATPQGHNLTAAETEFNVGVQGLAGSGPTQTLEADATAVANAVIGTESCDATKTVTAALKTVQ